MDVIDTNIMNVIACFAIVGCILLFVLIVIAYIGLSINARLKVT